MSQPPLAARPGRPSMSRRRRARLMRTITALLAIVAGALVLAAKPWAPVVRDVVATPAPYVQSLPRVPASFPGGSDECAVADPTGTRGCVTASTAWLLTELQTAFGEQQITCWSEHSWEPDQRPPRWPGL